ncbi:MAG: glutamate 5-kinase [Armatimonadota bacterium]|nr:glutamate 5-kinase [Armatimonadota bacterium]
MKRLVVKVGSSTLTTAEGLLDRPFIARLSEALAVQRRAGIEVVLVTSGAVSAGTDRLKIERPRSIPHKQAAAAVGQGILMGVYASCFESCGLAAAQILLTRGDVADRSRYTNARNTFQTLFRWGVVPIVNENDSVVVDEIRFGDNDTLAAIVGLITDASLVINLSDVDGLYDPSQPGHPIIGSVSHIDNSIEALARPSTGGPGTGGMVTKLRAARILVRSGIPMMVQRGRNPDALAGAVQRWQTFEKTGTDPGAPGTLFVPVSRRLQGRKRWIAYGMNPRGILSVNERARDALLQEGRSLLAAGVVDASGSFRAGDLVKIVDPSGQEIGRGVVNYSLEEVRIVGGKQSEDIRTLLGRETLVEVIHRDNLVMGA